MALDQKFFKKSTTAATGLADQEQGLTAYLDANDVDSYDGDGSIWYDIAGHEVNIPLVSDDTNNLKIHYDPSNTNSYSGSGTTLTNLAGNSLNATVVASRFDNDYDSGLKGYFDISTESEATISIPSGHPLNGDFTLEFWFRWQGTPGSGGHRFINESTDNLGFFYYKNYGWRFYEAGTAHSGYYGGSGGSIQANVWQHKVITFSGTAFKGYLDGNQIHSTTYTRPGSSLGSFNFGTTNITADKPDCDIGAIRMYDRALTAAEVGQNFRAGNNFSYSSIITSKHEATQGTLYTTNLNLSLDANNYSGSGDWQDGTNDNDGVISGATYTNDGNSDYFDFDGSNDYINVAGSDLNPANTKCIELWFNTDSTSEQYIISNNNGSGAYGYHMGVTSGKLFMWIYSQEQAHYHVNSSTGSSNTAAITVGKWNHAVWTMGPNASDNKIYLNGNLAYTHSSMGGGTFPSTAAYNGINIGKYTSSGWFNGKLAQVRAYSTALTQAQITTNYNATKELYQNPTALIDYRIDQYSGSGTSIANLGSLSNNAAELLGSLNYDKEVGDFFNIEGSGDGITTSQAVAINPSTDGMTIEMWVMITSDTQNYLFSFDGTGTTYNAMSYRANTDKILWFYRTGSGAYTGINTATITINKWHHLVATTDGDNAEIYLDGVVSETTTANAYSENYNEDLHFGNYLDLGQTSNAKIGDMRFYKGHISAAQVAQNYLATKNKYPNGNNATIGGSPTWSTNSSPAYNYWNLDASSEYFSIPDNPVFDLINEQSMEVWLYRIGTGVQYVIDKATNSSSNYGWQFLYSTSGSGGYFFQMHNAPYSGLANPTVSSTVNTWEHIVVTCNGNNEYKLYKNGSLGDTQSVSGNVARTTVGLTIGRYSLTGANQFTGRFGMIKFYDKTLSATEVTAAYNNTKGTYGIT